MTSLSRAVSFNAAAAQYAANRPSYPPALLDAVEELTGRPLPGIRVADIGAGTGIATAMLRERGTDVVAVEPGDSMAAQFRSTLPDVPIVRGDGNALPLADASRDLITYAQSWHWTDTDRSVPEALRVLRPGGSLAVWWNTPALDVPWISAQRERIAHHCGVKSPSKARPDDTRTARLAGLASLPVARRQVRWSRVVPLDTHLANISSHSAFLALDEADNHAFLADERTRMREIFPDETYVVDLLVASCV
ncbi:methyltransferase type 11 [Streptomyces albus subsp. albus]|nr:methyltransferase type 11 [Streptomyces albus subsp. albus]